jgi:hypothetical protein
VGTWGTGLYSGDFALDLRESLGAVCRLPRSGEQIVELLADLNPAARDPDDEDYTTFWLVVADQLHRRGIRSPAKERAIEIISKRTNLEVLAKLGMTEPDLKARARVLVALGEKLRARTTEKARKTLKRPEALVYGAGDVLIYPRDRTGTCRNPYCADEPNFIQTGWCGCVIVATGWAFEFLAWHQIVTCRRSWQERPTLKEVSGRINPISADVGTLSKVHAARIGLERLGSIPPPPIPLPSNGRIVDVVASGITAAQILAGWR